MIASSGRIEPLLIVGCGAIVLHPAVPSSAALAGGAALALTIGNPAAAATRVVAKRLLPLSFGNNDARLHAQRHSFTAAAVVLFAGGDAVVVCVRNQPS